MVSAGDVTGSSRVGCVSSDLTSPLPLVGGPRSGGPCGHSAVTRGTRHRQVKDKSHEMSSPLFGGRVAGFGRGTAGSRTFQRQQWLSNGAVAEQRLSEKSGSV